MERAAVRVDVTTVPHSSVRDDIAACVHGTAWYICGSIICDDMAACVRGTLLAALVYVKIQSVLQMPFD